METRQIVIVGGYGQVGQTVARALAPLFPGRVVVAGRSRVRAESFAAEPGYGVRGRELDVVANPAGVSTRETCLVIMCVDQHGTAFVERCLGAGVDYVDVTAKQESLEAIEQLDRVARQGGSTAVLSVGVVPGVSNLLAAHAAAHFDTLARVDLFLQLGTGDAHGEAAIGWTLDNLGARFDVYQEGRRLEVRSFGEHARVRFPGQRRARGAYRFNFPDQRVVARTLGIPTVSTWLCFDSALLTSVMSLVVRLGLWRLLRVPGIRRAAIRALQGIHLGSDACAVLARAEGRSGGQHAVREFALSGRREAELTGLVAADVARRLLTGHRPGGVLHLEQFVQPRDLLRWLQEARPDTLLQL